MNILAGDTVGLRWLVLDLNSFFASCEQQETPALRDRPIAVAPMLAETTCVIAASYAAKACGIRTGTMIAEARQMMTTGAIGGGMVPKIEGAVQAVEQGVSGVAIINGHARWAIFGELLTREGCGTLITRESEERSNRRDIVNPG